MPYGLLHADPLIQVSQGENHSTFYQYSVSCLWTLPLGQTCSPDRYGCVGMLEGRSRHARRFVRPQRGGGTVHLQKMVLRAIQDRVTSDVIDEDGTLDELNDDTVANMILDETEQARCFSLITKGGNLRAHESSMISRHLQSRSRAANCYGMSQCASKCFLQSLTCVAHWTIAPPRSMESREKVEQDFKAQLEPGFHVSTDSKHSTNKLHKIGCVLMLPGVDYKNIVCLGTSLPLQSPCDVI